MKAHSVDEEQLITALRIIKNRKSPIVIHCHHGSDRTGVVCALYRIIFQNVSKEDAIREMTDGGFGFHRIYKNIIRRIREADIERIKREVMTVGGSSSTLFVLPRCTTVPSHWHNYAMPLAQLCQWGGTSLLIGCL